MFLHLACWNTITTNKMTTIYNPKTLLRLYDASGTYLSTAVVLNNGDVLEVKNSDGKEKGQYASAESWQETRPDSKLNIDDTNASKIAPIRHKDKFGFVDQYGSRWTQWLLNMMYEGTPHLLEKEEVVTAYNNLTNLLARHSAHICPYTYSKSGRHLKYYEYNLVCDSTAWCGLPVYWKGAPPVGDVEIMKGLIDAYKVLYNLVGKDVRAYMKKMSDIAQATSDLKYYNKLSYKTGYRIRRIQRDLECFQTKMIEFNKKIEELKKIINS